MPINSLLILGAGGHAKVVVDAARYLNINIEIRDDNDQLQDKVIEDFKIKTPIGVLDQMLLPVHIAIGNNDVRRDWGERLLKLRKQLFTIIHPVAVIAKTSEIGDGCFIAAQAIVAPNAIIHNSCIINHGAIVDHDCDIGNWCHIAPNATLGGNVKMGENCFIGAGAVVLPGIEIADNVTVGAGAVVTKNIAPGQTVVGIPAK